MWLTFLKCRQLHTKPRIIKVVIVLFLPNGAVLLLFFTIPSGARIWMTANYLNNEVSFYEISATIKTSNFNRNVGMQPPMHFKFGFWKWCDNCRSYFCASCHWSHGLDRPFSKYRVPEMTPALYAKWCRANGCQCSRSTASACPWSVPSTPPETSTGPKKKSNTNIGRPSGRAGFAENPSLKRDTWTCISITGTTVIPTWSVPVYYRPYFCCWIV